MMTARLVDERRGTQRHVPRVHRTPVLINYAKNNFELIIN